MKEESAEEAPPVEARGSDIHRKGLFATRRIAAETRIIEYLGERVTKPESERRAYLQDDSANQNGRGNVFMFILNDRYDVDGDVPGNIAKYANHSCSPNAYSEVAGGRIWLVALRDIEPGEEILFDYGFDATVALDCPCRCGSPDCAGYMVGQAYRGDLKKLLRKRKKEGKGKKRCKPSGK